MAVYGIFALCAMNLPPMLSVPIIYNMLEGISNLHDVFTIVVVT